MKHVTNYILAWLLGVGGSVYAEDREHLELEMRKAAAAAVQERITDRELRLTEIANDIMRLDERLDGKVAKVVKRVSSIKDSTKSGYRVSQIKMEAIEGLARSIDRYQYKRAEIVREIREGRSGIPKEVLEEDAKHFDAHISKRVDQIIEISKSFTQDADVKKFEQIQGSLFSSNPGWSDETTRISEAWRQNRRDRTMNKKQRAEVVGALRKSIERHQIIIAGMRDSLANRRMTKADRDLMEAELNRHLRVLDERQGQLEEMLIVEQPPAVAVTRDAAQELQDALREDEEDMRQDMNAIFVKVAELNRERSKVAELKRGFAALQKWIADQTAEEKE